MTASKILNQPLVDLNGLTVRQYAESIGGVYGFFTEQQGPLHVKRESTRFITSGQKIYRKDKNGKDKFHNAVLMWNPQEIKFPNNICPYEERFNHGFKPICAPECELLGIFHVVLVDEFMSAKDATQIEKEIHIGLCDLPLGQRLHRVNGAGSAKRSTVVDGKRRVVGITCLPPDFFGNNPNVVIVASAH
jgi:hypothetical protein